MLRALKPILEIQELDMKMVRLVKLKKDRHRELDQLTKTRDEITGRMTEKSEQITEIKQLLRISEREMQEVRQKIAHFESQQDIVKRVEEFNALAQEIAQGEREKLQIQQRLTDSGEKLQGEEESLQSLQDKLSDAEDRVLAIKGEVGQAIGRINDEGKDLKQKRLDLAQESEGEVLGIYERLLKHHRDRVIVSIENRACNGCHILVTAQHENLVRKAARLVFCEHCSRIHFWQESELVTPVAAAKKRRRRVAVT